MAPRGKTRGASAAVPEKSAKDVVVNSTGKSSKLRPKFLWLMDLGAGKGRSKKAETPAMNGTASEPTKKALRKSNASRALCTIAHSAAASRGRAKKEETPAVATKAAPKRKKDESESEPELEVAPKAKKPKTTAAKPEVKDAGPKPKGPRRVRGAKNEINAIRYTEPLKVFVFGEGSSGELGLGAHKKAKDVKRPRYNEALTNMNVVKIATGGMHVIALTKDNKILTWGVNDNGALGRDTSGGSVKLRDMDAEDEDSDDDETGGLNELESTPIAVSSKYFPEDTIFVDVVAGDSCSFALTTEGAVYGWGTFRVGDACYA
jgi:regulator of chromosome condensation